jgi:hypothetical protein
MAELEELQLRVSLDDQASAKLSALREQLTQLREAGGGMGQGVAAAHGASQEGVKALTGAIRQAGFIGGIVGGITTELTHQLAALGTNLIQRATDFKGLSDSMQDLQTHARGVGMSFTGYEGLQRQLQLTGMSAKEAQGTISQLSDLHLELQQYGAQNAPTTHRLLQYADPASAQYLINFMRQMEGAPVAKQIDLITAAVENMHATMAAHGREGGFEAGRSEFLRNLGINPEAFAKIQEATQISKKLKEELDAADPKREQMLRNRTEETKKFREESLLASFIWEDIGMSLAASVLHGVGLNQGMSELNIWLKRIAVDAEAFERTLRDVDFDHALEQLGKMEPAIKPYVEQIKQLAGGLKATADTTLEEFQAILPILRGINDVLGQLGLGPPKPLAPPGTPEREQQEREAEQGAGLAGAGYAHRFLLRHGLISPREGEHIVPSENVEPETESPETSALAPWRRLLDYNRRQREAERKEAERTGTPPPPPPPPPPSSATEPPPSATELTPEQQERLQRRYRRGQRQSYEEGAGQPIIVPASMVTAQQGAQQGAQQNGGGPIILPKDVMDALIKSGQSETGGTSSDQDIHPVGFATKVGEHLAGEFLKPGGILKTGTELYEAAKTGEDVAKAQASGFALPKMPSIAEIILSALPLGLSSIPPMLKKDAEEGSPARTWLRGKLGIEDLNEAGPWEPGGAWHQGQGEKEAGFDKRFGMWPDQAPAPSAFENRFGVWPGMGAEKMDESAAKLDQAANNNVNISGAGKISVDVRAPPGTSVDAQGEGFFKSTEITRMTQMMPADFGPGPVTGVSAGQGVAANGTVGTS